MPKHSEIYHSPYSAEQLFQLVADVASYPEFLPWCAAARVYQEPPHEGLLADLTLAFGPFSETYTSHVILREPIPKKKEYAIHVHLVKGPFSHLNNDWRFMPKKEGGTEVEFLIDFAFRSKMLDHMMGGMFERAMQKMVAAFERRADALYKDSPQ